MDIEIISPTMGSVKQETISLSEFRFSDRGKIIACPQGHVPVRTKQQEEQVHGGL